MPTYTEVVFILTAGFSTCHLWSRNSNVAWDHLMAWKFKMFVCQVLTRSLGMTTTDRLLSGDAVPSGQLLPRPIRMTNVKEEEKRFVSEKNCFYSIFAFQHESENFRVLFFLSERDNKWTRKAEKAEFCFFLFIFFSRTKMNKNDKHIQDRYIIFIYKKIAQSLEKLWKRRDETKIL